MNGDAPPGGNGWPLWRVVMWGMIASLLVLPAVAMCFTPAVNWGAEDFLAAAVLLVGGGAAFELVTRLTRDARKRLALGAVILGVVALVWAQAAVGIF